MGAGLPLLIISLISSIVIILWMLKGAGKNQTRNITGIILLSFLLICWAVLLYQGVFSTYGTLAMGMGFVFSFLMLIVPIIQRRLISDGDT